MTALRWLLRIALGLVLLWAVVKESREPYLRLFLDDWLRPKPPPITLPLSPDGRLAVRLYTSTQPHIGKVARLQKGLVLVVDGRERIEEGFGFGLPLVVTEDGGQYLSRTASVEQRDTTLVKRYLLDTQDTPSGFLRRKYEPVPPIGSVVITYTVDATAGTVEIAADFSGVQRPWRHAYVMSEQGARTFTRYEEPGRAVEGREFRKWQPTVAREGCVVAADRSVRFCVLTNEPTHRYFGRERYNQYYPIGVYTLSWAGIDLELSPPQAQVRYRVVVSR